MSINRNYAKREEGQIAFAPAAFVDKHRVYHPSPTEADYLAAGWKRYIDAAPSDPAPDGYHYERDGYDETADTIAVRWHAVANPPPPPRTFQTADLVEVLMAEGYWDAARAWIVEHGILDLVLATKEFDETNANFAAGRAALQEALGLTDEQIEAILDEAAE
jgi:hypothetical protein